MYLFLLLAELLQNCSTVSQNNEFSILDSTYTFPNDPVIIMETNIYSNRLQL